MKSLNRRPKAFSVYCDCFVHIQLLNMQERGELFTSLFEYAISGKEADFESGKLQMAFSFMRAQMERDFAKYEATCERNRANAKSRKPSNFSNQSLPMVTNGNQYKDKDKDKDKEKNILLSADADAQPRFDYQSVIDTFNSVCVSLPKAKALNDKRRKAIKSASKNLGDISFTDLFAKVERSDFLTGRDGTWSAGFDWILKPSNLIKIIEGNYDNKNQPESTNTRAEREERKRMYNAYADDRY